MVCNKSDRKDSDTITRGASKKTDSKLDDKIYQAVFEEVENRA